MPNYVCLPVLFAAWIVWLIPFFRVQKQKQAAEKIDPAARWGVLIEGAGFFLIWMNPWMAAHPPIWRFVLAIVFLDFGALLSWTSALALGRQWRIDAGLISDHKLVRSGAYRFLRHPIYASMLCMLLGTGFMITPFGILPVAVVIFLIGTELRVRVEDKLLESRFGEEFREYRRSVPAYLPFIR